MNKDGSMQGKVDDEYVQSSAWEDQTPERGAARAI
jgi:hypothetical protein